MRRSRRRLRPRISIHAALFVALLSVAATLLVAAAQGPGTVAPVHAAGATDRPATAAGAAVLMPLAPVPAGAPSTPPPSELAADTAAAPTSRPPERLAGYRWPMSRRARITSFFDYRDTGFLSVGGRRIHEGVDMATYCGDEVWAAHAGEVRAAGRRFGEHVGFEQSLDRFYAHLMRRGGWLRLPIVVVIDDGNGYRSVYAHLRETRVKPGQRVKAGQVIGTMGDTGNASGCHLHYELIRMDGPWMAVARERVREDRYPARVRERVDPMRVLSLRDKGAPTVGAGVTRPKNPPRAKEPSAG